MCIVYSVYCKDIIKIFNKYIGTKTAALINLPPGEIAPFAPLRYISLKWLVP
jgi:hypothetical protein